MKFHEISGNFMKFPPENEKVDLALDRWPFLVVIFTSKIKIFHDFHEKSEISMNFMKFHHFHEKRTFCPKVHFGPPKPSIYAVLWKDFRPGPEKCAFSQKVALFAHFHTFRENHPFSWFWGFLGFPWKNIDLALYRWQEKLRSHLQGRQLLPKSAKWLKWALFSKKHGFQWNLRKSLKFT